MKIEEEKQINSEVLDNMKLLKEEYQHLHIPEEGRRMMNEKIEQAKLDKKRKSLSRRVRFAGGAVAAAMAVIVALPNTNESIAKAMGKIPVIGSIVKVVTFRDYDYQDGNSEAHVSVPNIEIDENSDNGNAANQINKDVTDYTQQLIDQFEADAKELYGSEGYKGLDVNYDVVTDTEDWFTLRVTILETAASGNQYYRFYHIDKKTNSVATLSTLFKDDVDYITPISENIKEQMLNNTNKDEENTYFLEEKEMPDENFKAIKADQNFYFNSNNDLVIVFDEYEVAPGSMGNPEFVIPSSVISGLLK